jgi:hypothetical protein
MCKSWGFFMTRRSFTLLLTFLLVAITVSAHGDKKHVIGTIEKLNSGSVTVKTRDGKSVQVKLVPSTVYVARVATADKPAALSDLAVGDNVVIHATPKGDGLEADEVRFSTSGASGSGSSKLQQQP